MTTSEPKRQALPNEAPPGAKARYKHTKLGWIPEDWDLEHLGNVIDIRNGQVDPKDPVYSAMTLVAPNHIESGTGRLIEKVTALKQDAISGKYLVERGQVIYSKIRPYLKKAILADEDCLCSADAYPISGKGTLDNRYLLLTMLSERFTYYAISASGRTGIPKVNREDLSDFMIALPPLPEQQRIAQVLGAWDRAIAKVQQLLAAQQERKRGLMSSFLSGKRRCLGFKGKWKEVKLEELGSFYKGKGITKNDLCQSGLPCVTYGELYTLHHIRINRFRSFIDADIAKTSQLIKAGDVLFAGSGETAEEIGKAAVYLGDGPAYAGGDVIILRPEGIDPLYLSYALSSPAANAQRRKLGQGNSVVHIYPSQLAQLKLLIPPLDEQKRMTTLFRALDDEIEHLNDQVMHLTTQKRGLMQQLLTGVVRVKGL